MVSPVNDKRGAIACSKIFNIRIKEIPIVIVPRGSIFPLPSTLEQ